MVMCKDCGWVGHWSELQQGYIDIQPGAKSHCPVCGQEHIVEIPKEKEVEN